MLALFLSSALDNLAGWVSQTGQPSHFVLHTVDSKEALNLCPVQGQLGPFIKARQHVFMRDDMYISLAGRRPQRQAGPHVAQGKAVEPPPGFADRPAPSQNHSQRGEFFQWCFSGDLQLRSKGADGWCISVCLQMGIDKRCGTYTQGLTACKPLQQWPRVLSNRMLLSR